MAKRTLHNVSNQEKARLLVESVKLEERRDYILSVDENMCTALHIAAYNDKVDVVDYLCRLFPKFGTLLLAKDTSKTTAPHYAKTKEIAECVLPERQNEVVFSADQFQSTALHAAAKKSKTNVVKDLCSLPVKDELLFAKDSIGCTALHYSSNQKIAQSLVESIAPERQRDFILSITHNQQTTLQIAAALGRTDVVEYLCSLPVKDELLLAKDIKGRTALHYSSNQKIAQSLVESVTAEKQRDFILSVTNNQQTALHVAAELGRTDIVEYLCGSTLKDELLFAKDSIGCTALHLSSIPKIAQSLVESVTAERRKDFIFLGTDCRSTALHVAAKNGRTDIVEYLCSLSVKEKLVLVKNGFGCTAVQFSSNQKIAQSLVKSVTSERQKNFILSVTNYQQTALDIAAELGRTDVVGYLCSLPEKDDLLFAKYSNGCTALHFSSNQKIAQLLVESVTPGKQRDFILLVTEDQRTALHLAAYNGRTDVVEYFCSLPEKDKLLFTKDSKGYTALHFSSNQKIAQLLVESVTAEKQRDFILSVADRQHTALHIAAYNGKTDVVEYLCSLPEKDELLFTKDSKGCTPLHLSSKKKIAESLVESVTSEKQREFILSVDNRQLTALHNAVIEGRADVVEYLCSLALKEELVLKKTLCGYTTLYFSSIRKIAQSLVESVTPERRRDFILLACNAQSTALHFAAKKGRTDVVEYLCSLPMKEELVFAKDTYDWTPLHYSVNKKIARIIVESTTPERQKDLILSVDKNKCTALHIAAGEGRTDVVEYLCSLPVNDDFLLARDSTGWTALYYSSTRKVAQSIIESLAPDKQRKILLSATENKVTALHVAADKGNTDVVKYLCSLPVKEELVFAKDSNGCTALHIATRNSETKIVQYLCQLSNIYDVILKKNADGDTALHLSKSKETTVTIMISLTKEQQRHLLGSINNSQQTVLHKAVIAGRTDVVNYLCALCSNIDEIILMKDKYGRTALHYASNETIPKLLLASVNPDNRRQFILAVDANWCTALHLATKSSDNTELVKYLCSISGAGYELMFAKNCNGATALHLAHSSIVTEAILKNLTSETLSFLLENEDNNGNTPILSLTVLGKVDALKRLLEHIDQWLGYAVLSFCLQKCNKKRQNLFHLAALSPRLDRLYDVLEHYLHNVDVPSMMHPDVYRNTPIHYITARHKPRMFADFMLRLSLPMRQRVVTYANNSQTTCHAIVARSFLVEKILEDNANNLPVIDFAIPLLKPATILQSRNIEDTFKVMNHAMNQYCLLTVYKQKVSNFNHFNKLLLIRLR